MKFEEAWNKKMEEHKRGFKAIAEACGIGILDGKLFVKKKMSKFRIYYRNWKFKRSN